MAIHAADRLKSLFGSLLEQFLASPAMHRVTTGEISVAHYRWFLRETYFYTREDPQIQAFATSWFKGNDRAVVRTFLKHAISEVGHDELALQDLAMLGSDVGGIQAEFPLPTTVALTSFPYWAIQFLSPVSYLGYLYFLESLPTSSGRALMACLASAGVPEKAMAFIHEHATIDVAHVKLMDSYVEKLVYSEDDLAVVSYAMVATARLYQLMIEGAFAAVEQAPALMLNMRELDRMPHLTLQAAE